MIWLLPVQKSLERPKIHQAVLGVAALLFVGPQFLLVSQASSPVDQTAKLFEPGIWRLIALGLPNRCPQEGTSTPTKIYGFIKKVFI